MIPKLLQAVTFDYLLEEVREIMLLTCFRQHNQIRHNEVVYLSTIL